MPDTSNTSATRATPMQHECHKKVQHECYTNYASVTHVKHFDVDNDTGKNMFSHPDIYYMASERLQGEE